MAVNDLDTWRIICLTSQGTRVRPRILWILTERSKHTREVWGSHTDQVTLHRCLPCLHRPVPARIIIPSHLNHVIYLQSTTAERDNEVWVHAETRRRRRRRVSGGPRCPRGRPEGTDRAGQPRPPRQRPYQHGRTGGAERRPGSHADEDGPRS